MNNMMHNGIFGHVASKTWIKVKDCILYLLKATGRKGGIAWHPPHLSPSVIPPPYSSCQHHCWKNRNSNHGKPWEQKLKPCHFYCAGRTLEKSMGWVGPKWFTSPRGIMKNMALTPYILPIVLKAPSGLFIM